MKRSIVLLALPLGFVLASPKSHKSCSDTMITVTSTSESLPVPTCSICADYIDDCGNTYGGCYDACKTPSPTFETPSCLVSTTSDLPSTCTRTLCVDYIDDCGQMYGTCYNDCLPEPPLTKPPCTPTSSPNTLPASCTLTVCADGGYNGCGEWTGGCWNECDIPTDFPTTPCETSSTPTSAETYETPCSISVCIDGVTPCGEGFGGCFPACDGIPTDLITTPYCSLTEATAPATTYYR